MACSCRHRLLPPASAPAELRRGARLRRARAHGGVHARPRRPRLRPAALPRGGERRGWAPPRIVGHARAAGAHAALRRDRGLQPDHELAPVRRAESQLADRVRSADRALRRRAALEVGGVDAPARTTPAARPTTTPGSGSRPRACSAPATSSSGARRTPATRRRCSATPSDGRAALRAHGGARRRAAAARATASPIAGAARVRAVLRGHRRATSSRCSATRSRC